MSESEGTGAPPVEIRPVVPLQRKFSPIPDAFQRDDLAIEEVWPGHFQRPSVEWSTLEQAWRVVILAEAGAGKTYELRAAAARLLGEGKAAFFIRLEDVVGGFDTAFEVGSADSFARWETGTDDAWFFLDSVDELRLTNARAFEDALGTFAGRIANHRQRAHVYISSRPYAWRAGIDRALVEGLLPFAPREDRQTLGTDPGVVETQQGEANAGFELFLLGQLSDDDVAFYARFRGVDDIDGFKAEVERAGLGTLIRRPFDLEDLLTAWQLDRALPNRLTVLQATTRRQVAAIGEGSRDTVDIDRALDGARLLAACATLTGEPNIRLPNHPHEDGIDATILFPNLSAPEIGSLLSAGIFGDPIYGTVRFRHREIRELLAAEWFAAQVQIRGNRTEINRLLFRSRYQVDLIPLRLRAIFPWLVLLDDDSRTRAFEISPEVAIEGGDVGRLSLSTRVDLLERLLVHLGEPGSPFRGLDYHQVSRIADPALASDVDRLIGVYAANDDAIFQLARIVTQGRMVGSAARLAPIAADPSRGIWARLVSAAAVMATGTRDEAIALWNDLLEAGEVIPRRLFTEILEHTPADAQSVAAAVAALDKLEPRNEHEIDKVSAGLHLFIDRLPIGSNPEAGADEPLLSLLRGLFVVLERKPWIERHNCHVSQEFHWLMPAALHCIERLVDARSPCSFDPAVLTVLTSAPTLSVYRASDFDERKSALAAAIPPWPELNDALFWWSVASRRRSGSTTMATLGDDWPVTWPGHFWGFDAASFERTVRWIGERPDALDKGVALGRSIRTFLENDRPEGWLEQLEAAVAGNDALTERLQQRLDTTPSPEMVEYQRYEAKRQRKMAADERRARKDRQAFARRIAEKPEDIRNPPGIPADGVSRGQWALLQTLEQDGHHSSRSRPMNWRALVPEFGEAVAEAFRDAATEKWRAYMPEVRSEGAASDQIPGVLLFAMAGLEIDAGEDGKGLSALSTIEIRWALRYAAHEMNGFPRWLEPLFGTHRDIVLAFLWTEVEWELRTSPPEQPHHYVLHDIIYYAPWLHAALAPRLLAWLPVNHAPNVTCLRYVRQILVSGGTTSHALAGLARVKADDPTTPPAHLPTYYAMLVDADPAMGVPLIEAKLATLPPVQAKAFAEEFLVALVGSHREATSSTGVYRRHPSWLKQLYILSFRYVKAADDIDRVGGGVYSPDRRDHAQEARGMLFSILSDIPGELAHRCLLELAATHPEPGHRGWMLVKARERAITDGDLSPRTTQDVADLAQRLERRAAAGRAAHAEA